MQDIIITKHPKNPELSRNGGDYHEGFRIWTDEKGYWAQYSWALLSDFESQCEDEPICFKSEKERDEYIAQFFDDDEDDEY